jgi:excisionase family DNA binding protein
LRRDGIRCNPLESFEHTPSASDDTLQSLAPDCRILVPSVSPGLLTVRDVARLLKVSTATVYRLASRGELPHVRVSNAIRVARKDLGAFLSRNRDSHVNLWPSDS